MGDDIIATKWIGIEGTSIVAREKEEELLNRFSRSFVETVKSFDQYPSVVPEAAVAVKHGVSAMHDDRRRYLRSTLGDGRGIRHRSGSGSEIHSHPSGNRRIMRSFSTESISADFQWLYADWLRPTDTGLVRELEKEGIHAAVIGRFVEGKAKKILNGEDTAFLERPKTDELYKIYE